MFGQKIYYSLKPVVPQDLLLYVRRSLALRKRDIYSETWPIDEAANARPKNWAGWPGGKKFALALTHDLESARSHEKCQRLVALEEKLGFRSSFNFVARDYDPSSKLLQYLKGRGFEVGVHGLMHNGNLFQSWNSFRRQAGEINQFLARWGAVGFRSPSMYHNLKWIQELNIEYDSSTFDTDPFEPQPDGVGTIFPFLVKDSLENPRYVEMPYTMPQDFTLFILLGEKDIRIWKKKLAWIARHGGMALLITHADYMNFEGVPRGPAEFPASLYEEFLAHVKADYSGQYWNALPREIAAFWKTTDPPPMDTHPRSKEPTAHRGKKRSVSSSKKIWIDLDNSPHVPFFSPIIQELESRGYRVILTARDCAQTCGLANLAGLEYRKIGRHTGKNRMGKVAGTAFRALQLTSAVAQEKPSLAVSHGSRAQMLSAAMLNVPSIVMMDYEHVRGFIRPTWILMPEVISSIAVRFDPNRILKYQGIKEDVYVPFFRPAPDIKEHLGLNGGDIVATIRPPATEAHYHNPESEALFSAAVNFLGGVENVRMVIIPRNKAQEEFIRGLWPEWCDSKRIVIPEQVVNGLNLLWHSDLVISGGGTMNREAAALGVPVYSIFLGKTGAVDRYLAEKGRLTLLRNAEDVKTRVRPLSRKKNEKADFGDRIALRQIVAGITDVAEKL